MNVRAKFQVDSIRLTTHGTDVEMSPVMDQSDPTSEDARFWDATPSGSIKMYIDNKKAAEQFKPGQKYYVDFTLAK